jgi:predicted membrane-bound mannosyltransferase
MSGPAHGDDDRDGETSAGDGHAASDVAGPIHRWEAVTLFRVVLSITLVALLVRVAVLGSRPAHWDEARVAYWAQYYAETGSLGYHWEEHGPVVQIAARWLFEPLGVTDTAARLPVGLVGGLLPLAALLYREHLRDSETVALALFLAFNPVLLYYSRFVRSDVLVAAFMFTALGMLVRFADTRRWRYLYGAGLLVALGFGSKENAVVYALTWAGAGLLVADQWLHSPGSDTSGIDRARRAWPGRQLGRLTGVLARWRGHVAALRAIPGAGADRLRSRLESPWKTARWAAGGVAKSVGVLVVTLGTTLFVFADRGEGVRGRKPYLEGGSGRGTLGDALDGPGEFSTFVSDTLRGAYDGYSDWFAKSSERTLETYIEFLDGFLSVLSANATVLVAFGVIGFVLERYGRKRPRPVVMFLSYCGVASLLGYPLGTDVVGAWAWVATHIVVPLAVPAAVGVAWVYREVLAAQADRDTLTAAGAGFLLLLAGVQVGYTAANDVYRHPQADDNELVQYAQPHDDLGSVVDTLETAAGETDGPTAVLYYGAEGEEYDKGTALVSRPNVTAFWDIRPTCSVWSNTQPMNWYFAVANATVDCERSPAGLAARVDREPPPVIFAVPDDGTVPTGVLGGSYEKEVYYTRTIGRELVVYTHESWS